MYTGVKFRCYPTKEQEKIFLQWIGCQRFIYNAKVQEDRYFRTFARKSLQHIGQYAPIDGKYSHFISEETAWLREVPSNPILSGGAGRFREAYERFFKGLGGRPKFKTKYGRQSVVMSNRLFRFEPVIDKETGEIIGHKLFIGLKRKNQLGELSFKATRAYGIPKMLSISVDAGKWFVSFNYDDGEIAPSRKETIEWLQQFSKEEIKEKTLGLDRGVAIPLATSNSEGFNILDIEAERVKKKEKYIRRWQRKQARRQKGSRSYKKTKQKVARYKKYQANVRHNFAHQTSRKLVNDPSKFLFVFEDLNIKNMTKRPKAKKDASGKYVRNGRAAKAGLNKSILASSWGKLLNFTTYKAERAGKLALKVPPQFTSQICSNCGHKHQDNRVSQSLFVCRACEFQDNADYNAARNIAERGISMLLEGAIKEKTPKRCSQHKKKLGWEPTKVKPVESQVSLGVGNSVEHETMKRESL